MKNTIIHNRYQVLKQLGTDGFRASYLAQDMMHPENRLVVIQHLSPPRNDSKNLSEFRRLFEQAAEELNKLRKKSQLPEFLVFIEDNQEFYLVWEYVEGHSLSEELQNGLSLEKEVITLLEDKVSYHVPVEELSVSQQSRSIVQNQVLSFNSSNTGEDIWGQGNRVIALASGGAFLGGFIAQAPGAILGAIAGAIFGFLVKVNEIG